MTWLRALGLIYLFAFGSLSVQIDGLIGSRGILPASEYLARARQTMGPGAEVYRKLPTLFWLNSSDYSLHVVCWMGIVFSLLLTAGLVPGVCTVVLWSFYLSLTTVGQVFFGYQWDSLLLESGLLAILLTPWVTRLERANDEPGMFTIWLIRWLLFRLTFLSGIVKIFGGDPAWSGWKALEYYYQTQPLPAWTSWYFHRMPVWFHWLSVGVLLYAELIAPFLMLGPRPIRLFGCVCLVVLQVLIAASGNYGFFNLLTIVLCLSLLDDRDCKFAWTLSARFIAFWRPRKSAVGTVVQTRGLPTLDPIVGLADQVPDAFCPWSNLRRTVVGFVALPIVLATTSQFLSVVWPSLATPAPFALIDRWLGPLRSTNHYGLFAFVTMNRPEIIVEGSDDGTIWKPYHFRWKPQELDHRPRFATPHLPRLDWQMWFAAIAGDCSSQVWFLRFEQRLLAGSPEVLALLQDNPFPDHPPNLVRASLFQYGFSNRGSSDWWTRQNAGSFCPPIGRSAINQ